MTRLSDLSPKDHSRDALVGLVLPCTPTQPLSANEARGMPWRAVDQRLRPWKDAVTWVAKGRRKWAHQVIAEHGLPLVIRVTIPFPVERRRDPHNYTSTVVKAVVDGLVAARWVNDDTAAWIEVADSLLVVGGNPKVEILLDAQGGAPE